MTAQKPAASGNAEATIADWIIHDMRRTATTIMAERLKVPPHVAYRILNHASANAGTVAEVYNRAAYLDERKEASEALGRYVGRAASQTSYRYGLDVLPTALMVSYMDAFYASEEQRDRPELRGKPVAVGHGARRGVVATGSYNAHVFGVRSALPSLTALRKCPELIFVPPRFEVYRAVSQQVHAVFAEFADLLEPLSLDEAYLDVTANTAGRETAWQTAKATRARIMEATGLAASAGVSYNKFLGQTRLKPTQARWTVRHPASRRRGIRRDSGHSQIPRCRTGNRQE